MVTPKPVKVEKKVDSGPSRVKSPRVPVSAPRVSPRAPTSSSKGSAKAVLSPSPAPEVIPTLRGKRSVNPHGPDGKGQIESSELGGGLAAALAALDLDQVRVAADSSLEEVLRATAVWGSSFALCVA